MLRRFAAFFAALILSAQVLGGIPSFSAHRVGFQYASSNPTGSGFYPAGHWIAAKQSMIQVYPRPDSETATWARHHWAFYNGTTDIPYDVAIGVSFGAYPYVFTLISGPPGMTISQPIYNGFQNKNYGRVTWHPQGNISGQCNDSNSCSYTVQVKVTDQQNNSITLSWKLQTDDDSTTYEPVRHFEFVSPTGTGTTCTYSSPCQLSTAFGATFGTSSFAGSIVYAFAGNYSGSSGFPQYTDNDIFGSSTPLFEVDTATKPAALIGLPGQTATFDATATQYFLTTNSNSADWYMENITANGYITTKVPHLIGLFGAGVSTNERMGFDQIAWSNSGYGTGTNNNESFFQSPGKLTPKQYLFITDSTESNREGGAVGNNYAFCDFYSYQYALVQRSTENSPAANFDAVFYYKSDIQNSEFREDYANVSGAGEVFSYGQNQYILSGSNESDYNLGLNVGHIVVPQTAGYSMGNFWIFRNTLLATGDGLHSTETAYNLEGPAQSAPVSTTGSLAAGTYYAKFTSLGPVSGESAGVDGILGGSNQKSITLSATGGINFSFSDLVNSSGSHNIYIGTSSNGENIEFNLAAGVTSFTYTGQAGTAASPPSTSTAVSSSVLDFDSNVAQGTSAALSSGAWITGDTLNVVAPSGLINTDGTLYSGNPNYSTYLGTRGYQIQ